jgi:mono/diheme cytochrome c family protein
MRGWMVVVLLCAACNGDKDDGQTGDTGDSTPQPQTTSTGAPRIATILSLTGDATAGGQTYTTVCAACHGADGTGVEPNPALTERVPTLSDEQILTTLLEGKGNMDSYRFLKNQELASVLAYLRANFDT